jgi:hypothetical protein
MSGIHIILIATGLIGMLPLIVILWRLNKYLYLIKSGIPAKARIYHAQMGYQYRYEVVWYCYYGGDGQIYRGSLKTDPGKYRINDVIDVKFHPINFKRSAVPGPTWAAGAIGFGVLIAAAIWYGVYELFGMVQAGSI